MWLSGVILFESGVWFVMVCVDVLVWVKLMGLLYVCDEYWKYICSGMLI